MALFVFLLLGVCLCLVKELSPKNIVKTLEGDHTALIITRVNNCTTCEQLKVAFEFVQEKTNNKVNLYQINVDRHPTFLIKYMWLFGSAGRKPTNETPVVFHSKYGKIDVYNGPQDINSIVAYLKHTIPIQKIVTPQKKAEFMKSNQFIKVVGYFKSEQTIFFKKVFKRLNHMYSGELRFGVIFENKKKIAKTLGLDNQNWVIISKPLESRIYYKSKKKSDKTDLDYFNNLRAFIEKNVECLICPVTSRNVGKLFRSHYNVIVGFLENYDSTESSRFLESYRESAVRYFEGSKDKQGESIIFSYTLGGPVEEYLKTVGQMETIQYPAMMAIAQLAGKKFVFDRTKGNIFNSRDVDMFLRNYFEDSLSKKYESEKEPADNMIRYVTKLTADNFGKNVLSEVGKSFMVVLTREGCPHCKNLKPLLEFVGKHYQVVREIGIGEFDVQKNTHEFNIEHVPTIYFYTNCEKEEMGEYIVFRAIDKTASDWIDFIEENRCSNRMNEGENITSEEEKKEE